MKRLLPFLLLLLLTFNLFSLERVILYFDVNKTIIAEDSAGGKSVEDVIKEISKNPLEASCLRQRLRFNKAPVFPSFYRLINYLKARKISYTIVLRTFGTDLPRVIPEIEAKIKPARFTLAGEFKEGSLTLQNKRVSLQEAYAMIKNHNFVAIRDDYQDWINHHRSREFGKRFFFDPRDKETLSLFFDDNIALDGAECIVTPVDVQTGAIIEADSNLVKVNTCMAILDNDYYVKLVSLLAPAKCKRELHPVHSP